MDSLGCHGKPLMSLLFKGAQPNQKEWLCVHANPMQVTASSTAYWIAKLSIGVVSLGSSVEMWTLIHSVQYQLEKGYAPSLLYMCRKTYFNWIC